MNNINWENLERKEEKIEFTIEEIEFNYKPTTESEMFEYYHEYMESYQTKKLNKQTGQEEEITKKRANPLKLFKVKLRNLECQVPKNIIKQWLKLNEEIEFTKLSPENKYKILGKIDKVGFLDKLVSKVQSIDEPDEEVKKK